MFTGIITQVGKIVSKQKTPNGITLRVDCVTVDDTVKLGSSVAISGVCLTVTNIQNSILDFDVMPETIKKTSLKNISVNDQVNIEFSLKFGDEMGGHMVFGHVDDTTQITDVKQDGDAIIYTFLTPSELTYAIVPQGTVSIDGISLTIAQIKDNTFSVSIVQHTLDNTTIANKKINDYVNIEADMLAKYVSKAIRLQTQ